MSYISDNYNVSKRFELESKNFSPYIECWQNNQSVATVNGLFRFADIIQTLVSTIDIEKVQEKEYSDAFSTLFHILANYDFLSGLCKNDLENLVIEKDILQGMLGSKVTEFYHDLDFHGKIRLLELIKKRNISVGRKCYAHDALRTFLGSELQYYAESVDEIIYYIPLESKAKNQFCRNMDNENVYEVLGYLFFDLHQKHRAIWTIPMGIIDFEETMRIDNIQIY